MFEFFVVVVVGVVAVVAVESQCVYMMNRWWWRWSYGRCHHVDHNDDCKSASFWLGSLLSLINEDDEATETMVAPMIAVPRRNGDNNTWYFLLNGRPNIASVPIEAFVSLQQRLHTWVGCCRNSCDKIVILEGVGYKNKCKCKKLLSDDKYLDDVNWY